MKDSVFRILVIALLVINTFFIGGIWCALKYSPCGFGSKAKFCPLGAKGSQGKICPITGKPLDDASGSMKGSMQQQ